MSHDNLDPREAYAHWKAPTGDLSAVKMEPPQDKFDIDVNDLSDRLRILIGEVSDEDIAAFRSKVNPKRLAAFDALMKDSYENIMKIVGVSKLPSGELTTIAANIHDPKLDKHLPGIHSLGGILSSLRFFRNDIHLPFPEQSERFH